MVFKVGCSLNFIERHSIAAAPAGKPLQEIIKHDFFSKVKGALRRRKKHNDYDYVMRRRVPTRPVLVEYGLHEIIHIVVGGKEISHVPVAENAALDWICSAERS